jgi:hypothetical protein
LWIAKKHSVNPSIKLIRVIPVVIRVIPVVIRVIPVVIRVIPVVIRVNNAAGSLI